MKKLTIWIVGAVMVLSCLGLLYMQVDYINAIGRMRREHFDEGVRRSLYQTAYNLELNEMRYYLSKNIQKDIQKSNINSNNVLELEHSYFITSDDGNIQSVFEMKTIMNTPANPHKRQKTFIIKRGAAQCFGNIKNKIYVPKSRTR